MPTAPRSDQLADLFEAVADAVPDRLALVADDTWAKARAAAGS